jgi:hypothetical protein
VLVVGVGATGTLMALGWALLWQYADMVLYSAMSATHRLSQHPDKFQITLLDAVDYGGGQAFVMPLGKEKLVPSWAGSVGVEGGYKDAKDD